MVAEDARAFTAEIAEDVHGPLDLALVFGKGLSLFARHLFAELCEPAFENLRRLEQILSAPRRRHRRPRRLDFGSRIRGCLHVLGARSLKEPHHFVGVGRIDVGEGLSVAGRNPLACDIIIETFGHRFPGPSLEPPLPEGGHYGNLPPQVSREPLGAVRRVRPARGAHMWAHPDASGRPYVQPSVRIRSVRSSGGDISATAY